MQKMLSSPSSLERSEKIVPVRTDSGRVPQGGTREGEELRAFT